MNNYLSRNKRKRSLAIVTLLVLLGFYPASDAVASQFVGKPAPDEPVFNYQGEPRTLSFYRGKGVILNFWATWCAPCREEMPIFNEIHDIYKGKGVVVIGANYHQKKKSIARFLKKTPMNFPILLDDKGKLGDKYRLKMLPSTFFIDKDGVVVGSHFGPLSTKTLKEWAAKLAPDE